MFLRCIFLSLLRKFPSAPRQRGGQGPSPSAWTSAQLPCFPQLPLPFLWADFKGSQFQKSSHFTPTLSEFFWRLLRPPSSSIPQGRACQVMNLLSLLLHKMCHHSTDRGDLAWEADLTPKSPSLPKPPPDIWVPS